MLDQSDNDISLLTFAVCNRFLLNSVNKICTMLQYWNREPSVSLCNFPIANLIYHNIREVPLNEGMTDVLWQMLRQLLEINFTSFNLKYLLLQTLNLKLY